MVRSVVAIVVVNVVRNVVFNVLFNVFSVILCSRTYMQMMPLGDSLIIDIDSDLESMHSCTS